MKTLITFAAIVLSSFGTPSYAAGIEELNRKIESITLESAEIEQTDRNHADFVSVNFTINEQGKIEVEEMNYSNEDLKNLLLKKLDAIQITEKHNTHELFSYKFSFEFV